MTNFSCPRCGARHNLETASATTALTGTVACFNCYAELPGSLLADVAAADARAAADERALTHPTLRKVRTPA